MTFVGSQRCQEGLATGEGRALRLLAEIYAKQEQHKAAIRRDFGVTWRLPCHQWIVAKASLAARVLQGLGAIGDHLKPSHGTII